MPRRAEEQNSPRSEKAMSHAKPVSKTTGGRNRRAMRLLSMSFGQEIEMVRRTFAMADGQAMPDRFRQIGLGRLNRIGQRLASRQLRRDRDANVQPVPCVCGVSMNSPLKILKNFPSYKISVRGRHEMTALDQHVLAPHLVNTFAACRASARDLIGIPESCSASSTLGVMTSAIGINSRFKASMASISIAGGRSSRP